jgi:hypothetical protein
MVCPLHRGKLPVFYLSLAFREAGKPACYERAG